MKLLRTHVPGGDPERRGAALLLAFLVLIVIIAITHQITYVTGLDQSMADKDLLRTQMDHAIESALLQVYEQLAEDAQAAAAGAMGEPGGGDPLGGGGDPGGGDPAAGGGGEGAVDSKMDDWARPAATSINGIELRILIQDEDSKYNVLNMLAEDEDLAQAAYDRVVRILDKCREGTLADIGSGEADEMARAMRDHLLQRQNSLLPRPRLLSDDEENENLGMPLSFEEFAVLEPFGEHLFRDYFDRDGERVHSIGSFLTMWTAPSVGGDGPTAGNGYGVNVNTAPLAVMASLMDNRDVSSRFWDDVLEYRNTREEDDETEEETEPALDEFGNEILPRKFFDDIEELSEVYEFGTMEPAIKEEVEALLTVESNVFSVFVTARVSTAVDGAGQVVEFQSLREREEYERSGKFVLRTVRAVLWRVSDGEEASIVSLQRWEVLDYAPMEVLDYREDF